MGAGVCIQWRWGFVAVHGLDTWFWTAIHCLCFGRTDVLLRTGDVWIQSSLCLCDRFLLDFTLWIWMDYFFSHYDWMWPLWLPNSFLFQFKSFSLGFQEEKKKKQRRRMLGTNVMVVIKGCVSTIVSLKEKGPSSPSLSFCVWLILFMFHLSLADVSWVKLNSWQWGGEITAHPLFFMSGDRISPGRPWSPDCLPDDGVCG